MSRVSPGTILLLFVAVLVGLLGAYVVRQSLKPRTVAQRQAENKVTVPMASTDLKVGRQLTMGDIALMKMTSKEMQERGIRGPFMSDTRHIMGRILQTDLKRGATFETTMFYPEGFGHGIEDRLAPGYRAITVSVEADDALLGFAGAGAWVDVLFRSQTTESRRLDSGYPETTVTLMENIEILALGKDTVPGAKPNAQSSGRRSQSAVTLAVTPDQAAALRVVEGHGILSLVLRRPDDAEATPSPSPKTLGEVLNQPRTRTYLDVYRGRRMQRIHFESQGRSRTSIRRVGQSTTPDTAQAALESNAETTSSQ